MSDEKVAEGGDSVVARATKRPRAQMETQPRNLLAKERTRDALNLRIKGLTFDAIGASLGVSREAARKAVNRALEQVKAVINEDAEELRATEALHLMEMRKAIWPEVLDGNLRAIDRALRLSESYRRLLNLDLRQDEGAETGATYIIQAGGDISLVPPGGTALDVRAPWERGEVVDGEADDAAVLPDEDEAA